MQSEKTNEDVPVEVVNRILSIGIDVIAMLIRAQGLVQPEPRRRGLRRGDPSAMNTNELEKHVQRAGGVRLIARSIGVHEATVWGWRRGAHRVRPEHAVSIRALPTRSRPKPGRPKNPCILPADEVRQLCQSLGGVKAASRAIGCSRSTLNRAACGRFNLPPQLADILRTEAQKNVARRD